jgi:hypothetical protein
MMGGNPSAFMEVALKKWSHHGRRFGAQGQYGWGVF